MAFRADEATNARRFGRRAFLESIMPSKTHSFWKRAVDSISDGIYLMHGESPEFAYVNESAARSLGYTREELTSGMGVLDINPTVNQAIWDDLIANMKKVRHARVESTHRTRDGRLVPVEVTGNYFEFEGALYNLAIVRDISERRALEEQLRHAQKMEAVGQLAGGIAHDFNNMLAVIEMVSSTLRDDPSLAPAVANGLLEIANATDRAAKLTRQLLVFSRRQVADMTDLDLSEVTHHAMKLLRRLLGEQITIDAKLESGIPFVSADPGMLEQVLMNLAINARDAMPQGGRFEVRVDKVQDKQPPTTALGAVSRETFVCLTVSDTGSGIAPDVLPRIFEPFFTSKKAGEGTGLGLATVSGIVELHRGWIEVESTVGVGTTFRVFLPAVDPNRVPRVPAAALGPLEGTGTEIILLLEDDPAVRAATRIALERYGYRILEAESADEAIGIWGARSNEIELLLTDLVMPGSMSGRQVAERLVAEAPALQVVFTSGYSPEIVNRILHLAPGQILLQKPYSAKVLASAVRRCLDARRTTRPTPSA
jgi:PAS domain S-box-containing protein